MCLTLLLIIGVMWGAILTPVAAEELNHSFAAPPPLSAGEAFAKYCAACHGVGGRGGAVPGLSKPAPDLTKLTLRNGGMFPRESVARSIDGRGEIRAHGSREMPVWGDWFKLEAEEAYEGPTEEEAKIRKRVEDLLDFLESIQD
jgi:hypothetical protein